MTGTGLFYYAALAGAVSGAAGAIAIKSFGSRLRLIDTPNERSSHSSPTPRGGGVGIFTGYAAAAIISAGSFLAAPPGAAVGLLGFVEDRLTLSSSLRLLLLLLISAAALVLLKGAPATLPALALFGLWVVFACGTANFYNFMDGANGMAALTGVVAFASLACYAAFVAGDAAAAAACVFIAFSCMGFLPFNFPVAGVFMGDGGSMFLGFEFAFFVIRFSASFAEFLCVAMFLSIFYADCLLTLAMRRLDGEAIMKAHRRHLYQYLCNELGFPHWQVSSLYAAAQAVIAILSIAAYSRGLLWQAVLFVFVSLAFLFLYRSIKERKPREAREGRAAGAAS